MDNWSCVQSLNDLRCRVLGALRIQPGTEESSKLNRPLGLACGELCQPWKARFHGRRVSAQVILRRARIGRSRHNLEDAVSFVPREAVASHQAMA
jgi:hypothetical protein